MKLTHSRKGDMQELLLCTLLMKRGYEVFRNVSCNGPMDIIAVNKNTMQTFYIDCKSPIIATDGTLKNQQHLLKTHQHSAGIIPMTAWKENIYYWSLEDRIAKEF
tara:strand:+ start:184 stop:498 length:315 start_codon:yes stop_codon:yes gene_type:complete